MSFDAFETSIEAATPVEIFQITAGSQSFFYTSAEDDQLVSAQTYTAIAGLQRGPATDGPDKREHDFQIELPTTDDLAQLFVGVMPGIRVRLQVRKFHRDDGGTPEVIQIFDGFIQSASFKKQGKLCILTARTIISALGRQVPRRTYQSGCNHILYDPLTCRVDDTDLAFRAPALTVASQVGNILTVSSGLMGTFADGFMNGGFIEVIGLSDFRMVQIHVGNVLTMHVPFSVAPTLVNVFAGCAHTIAICGSKFDNVNFYGGFAFVPTRNIYSSGLI